MRPEVFETVVSAVNESDVRFMQLGKWKYPSRSVMLGKSIEVSEASFANAPSP
jgi:hypothetical protein